MESEVDGSKRELIGRMCHPEKRSNVLQNVVEGYASVLMGLGDNIE